MNRRASLLLYEQFDEQATRTPDTVALAWKGESITFAELRRSSDRLAGYLRSRGIRDGAAVGLHMERSINFVVCVLAILKSDSAVVPLPPSYPEERLREILAFSALDAVIDEESTALNPNLSKTIIHFSDAHGDLAERGDHAAASSEQAAFVLCSSGSTGQPKMIVRSHRSFFHRLSWTWENHPYANGEVCVQKSHMTTTHAIYELFEPLLRGTPVHIIPDDEARNLELFWNTIREKRVSRLLIVPSVLQVSLDMPGFVAPPIKVLVLMGEYVHHKLAGSAIAAFPQQTGIFSIYGSTEASSTLVCDLKESHRPGEELALGKPISRDVQVLVLSPTLEPVAAGDTGLLHVAGPALFTEYFRNTVLTEASFAQALADSRKLYNTQDQVRLLPDGNLQFVGRVDDTVKVRGYRVDLGEVERTLLLNPGVKQAAVFLGDRGAENSALLAFFAPATADHSQLYDSLRNRLPHYMIPSALIGLDSFPLTSSGKADRKRMLADHANRALLAHSTATQSATESRIVDVWRKVLGHGDFQRDDNFFEIGGTSLSVFSAVHHVREAFELRSAELSVQSIYQFPTVAQLASHVDNLKSGNKPIAVSDNSILVTLKKGDDPSFPPLFVIASAGGTLGAYTKLAKALKTGREIIGVRDPFNWGERTPTMGFQKWIDIYLTAIKSRQANGPYYVCAYSTAGAMGYEIAQRLRKAGQEVALLALIDPLAIGGKIKKDFGFYTLEAMFRGREYKLLVRIAGLLRLFAHRLRLRVSPKTDNNAAITQELFAERVAAARANYGSMISFSALLELNTGLPFTLAEEDFAGREPDQYLGVLRARVEAVAPDVDPELIENVFLQMNCLQIAAQHQYRLQDYGGKVVIFEPAGPHVGLLAAQFRPYVKYLRMHSLPLGTPSERTRTVSEHLSGPLRPHYLSMRDDVFVGKLAQELDTLLR